jgi:NADPH2:quinone reductase
MKELLISAGPKVSMVESPIPTPSSAQIIIKVIVCGANPKDWSRAERYGGNINQGDDVAGIVHSVGDTVVEFKVS